MLLSFADGSPALAVSHPVLGTVLVCNFSVNELASNMARQRAFPAWIQDLVKTLENTDAREKTFEAGDEIRADVWQSEMKSGAAIGPDGKQVRTNSEPEGDRYHVSFVGAQPGIYRLDGSATPYAFPVNVPPDESDLRAVDADALPRRLEANQQAHFVEGESDFRALNNGRPLFHYFIFAVLALLLMELAVQIFFRRVART